MSNKYRYNRISPTFWTDRKVLGWGDDTKLLALYLMTCEHRITEGLFRLPKAYICADLGWDETRLRTPWDTLCRDGFLKYDDTVSVVLLTNALKWNPTDNDSHAKGAVKRLEAIPETPLLWEFMKCAERYDTRLYAQCVTRYGTPLSSSSNSSSNSNSSNNIVEPDGPTPSPDPSPPKFGEESVPYQLAAHLRSAILHRDPETKVPDEDPEGLERWSTEADRMIRIDKRDVQEATNLMTWCQQDPFWSTNVLSMTTFRKQYDKLKRQSETARGHPRRKPRESAAERLLREQGVI